MVLGAVCKPVAESPAVAHTLASTFLNLPKWKLAIEELEPEALALLNLVIKPFDEELPSDEPSAFLIPVCNWSTDDEPFAESLALLIDVLI